MKVEKRPCHPAAVYLALTFGGTWLIRLASYAASISAAFHPLSPEWLIRLGTAVPSLTGLALTYVYGRKEALQALLHSLTDFKASWTWWLYTMLLFPLILLSASAVFLLAGGSRPPAQFPVLFIPLAFFYILLLMGPLGEELGWRGFLLSRFLRRWGVVKAGTVLGFIWSAWHIPLFLIPGTIQNELAQMGLGLALPGYFLYTSCISLLMTVLYAGTHGNLLLCLVFHTVCNLSLGVYPLILEPKGGAVLIGMLVLVTLFIVKFIPYKGGAIEPYENSGRGR